MKKNLNPNNKWWVCEEDYPMSPYADWEVRLSDFYDNKEKLENLIKETFLQNNNKDCKGSFNITNKPCYRPKSKSKKLYKKIYLNI